MILSREQFYDKWNLVTSDDHFQLRIDANHPLNMFINISSDGFKQIIIVTKHKEYITYRSSKLIHINRLEREDDSSVLIFRLTDKMYSEEFIYLFYDLYVHSFKKNNEIDSLKNFFSRLRKWQILLEKNYSYLLSEKEIKGLLGELKFMYEQIKHHGCFNIIDAWMISKDSSRDFILDNIWYEVKTISLSSSYITISSIEQLDHSSDGLLYVYNLERVNNDETYCTLPKIICKISELLTEKVDLFDLFETKLLKKGYIYLNEYDGFKYKFIGTTVYSINSTFPRIVRRDLNRAISNVSYEIRLSEILDWRVD